MTHNEAVRQLKQIVSRTNWLIIYLTRSDVAVSWYPEDDDAQITDQQWEAVVNAQAYKNMGYDRIIQDRLCDLLDEVVLEARNSLEAQSTLTLD